MLDTPASRAKAADPIEISSELTTPRGQQHCTTDCALSRFLNFQKSVFKRQRRTHPVGHVGEPRQSG